MEKGLVGMEKGLVGGLVGMEKGLVGFTHQICISWKLLNIFHIYTYILLLTKCEAVQVKKEVKISSVGKICVSC